VDSVLGFEPGFDSQFRQILSVATASSVSDPDVKKRSPPTELPSLWGMRVQAKSLLMMHPGKR